jgi:hypothetical protein
MSGDPKFVIFSSHSELGFFLGDTLYCLHVYFEASYGVCGVKVITNLTYTSSSLYIFVLVGSLCLNKRPDPVNLLLFLPLWFCQSILYTG